MAVVLLLGTMVETVLALISELRRISLCSLVAIARTVGFPHRVRRILGNPSGFDQHQHLDDGALRCTIKS